LHRGATSRKPPNLSTVPSRARDFTAASPARAAARRAPRVEGGVRGRSYHQWKG
jgi:hypothetical protein